MNKFKAKQLLALAEKLKEHDPLTSRQIKVLVEGVLAIRHKPRSIRISATFKKAIDIITEKLSSIPHALVGGLAVQHWVPSRNTDDLDFAVLSTDYTELKKLFPAGHMGALVYTVEVENIDVDFLLSDDWSWSKEAIANAEVKTLTGIPLKVVRPEYLILYKMESSRDRDIDDILRLLRLAGIAGKTRKLFEKYLPESLSDFDQLVEESKLGL